MLSSFTNPIFTLIVKRAATFSFISVTVGTLVVREVQQSATLTVEQIFYCSMSRRFDIASIQYCTLKLYTSCAACDRVKRKRLEVGAFTER
jgi:hypothetical protein